jgi:long-chain acyl-CoA synthetase
MLENKMKESIYIEQIMVVGESQKFPAALIIPDFVVIREWCKSQGIEYTLDAEMIRNQQILKLIFNEITHFNKEFPSYEQLKKFTLLSTPWTVEGGEITPTLKPKRKSINTKYKAVIDGMYE